MNNTSKTYVNRIYYPQNSEITTLPRTTAAIYNVGAYNPNSDKEELITSSTGLDRYISTTTDLYDTFGLDVPFPHLVNLPIHEVGSQFQGSLSLVDRKPLLEFDEVHDRGEFYATHNHQRNITVGQWAKANGRLRIKWQEKKQWIA